jgi:hypothetical protein
MTKSFLLCSTKLIGASGNLIGGGLPARALPIRPPGLTPLRHLHAPGTTWAWLVFNQPIFPPASVT